MKPSKFIVLTSILFLVSCATSRLDIEPGHRFKTETGFSFHFPTLGDWARGPQTTGQISAGQIFERKSSDNGLTRVAVARHGPILTPKGQTMTNRQMLQQFKKNIEDDAKNGRVKKVQSSFQDLKYKNADCLSVTQKGEDEAQQGVMTLLLEARICIHPKRPYTFMWLSISERRPIDRPASPELGKQTKEFFESLEF